MIEKGKKKIFMYVERAKHVILGMVSAGSLHQ